MPISPPYGVTLTATSGTEVLVEGYCGDNYVSVDLYFDGNLVPTRNLMGPWTPGEYFSCTEVLDNPIFWNEPHYYEASGSASGHSDKASSNSVTLWHDEITVYISASGTVSQLAAIGDVCSGTVGVYGESISSAAFHDTVSATVGVSGTVDTAQSIKTNYALYLGDITGKVYTFSPDILSFNGASINSYWTSKITDFSEINPAAIGKWKSIYWAKVKYVDKSASTPLILSYSVDNGAWTPCTMQYVGTGDGGHKDAYFHMIATGKYFQFKVEWPSADKTFQFTGLEIAGVPLGDEFRIA